MTCSIFQPLKMAAEVGLLRFSSQDQFKWGINSTFGKIRSLSLLKKMNTLTVRQFDV